MGWGRLKVKEIYDFRLMIFDNAVMQNRLSLREFLAAMGNIQLAIHNG